MILLICSASPSVGLGHLSRMLSVAASCTKSGLKNIHICIVGQSVVRKDLSEYSYNVIPADNSFCSNVLKLIANKRLGVLIFDIHSSHISSEFNKLLDELIRSEIYTIGVDSLLSFAKKLNVLWIPSFLLPPTFTDDLPENIIYGWDTYLIQKRVPGRKWEKGNNLLVLTGGSDAASLGEILPELLDEQLPSEIIINWVQGPFAPSPLLPAQPSKKWMIHQNLTELDSLIVQCNYAITVFGVSFFELLQYGIPTVTFSPYGDKDTYELSKLKNENVAVISKDCIDATMSLCKLINNKYDSREISNNAIRKMSKNGADRLAKLIIERRLSRR